MDHLEPIEPRFLRANRAKIFKFRNENKESQKVLKSLEPKVQKDLEPKIESLEELFSSEEVSSVKSKVEIEANEENEEIEESDLWLLSKKVQQEKKMKDSKSQEIQTYRFLFRWTEHPHALEFDDPKKVFKKLETEVK